jgi:hypothetical protein
MTYRETALTMNDENHKDSIEKFKNDDELSTFSQILDELQHMEKTRPK